MIDNIILEALESFCKEHVCSKIELMVPNDDDITKYKLMHPNAFIGWLPPPNQLDDVPALPDGTKSAIPAVVIGMDEGIDDGNDAGINIRMTFIVSNPGLYPAEGGIKPNFKGYQDLLNFIFICRRELATRYIIADGKTSAQRPFSWGLYQQQPAGYWVGWLTFRATAAILPFISETNYILD